MLIMCSVLYGLKLRKFSIFYISSVHLPLVPVRMVYGRFPDGYFPGWFFFPERRFPESRFPVGHFSRMTMRRFPERLREW